MGSCDAVHRALEQHGLLLLQDKSLASVVGMIAGETLRGSWWSHAKAQEIFQCMERFRDDEVVSTRLAGGKVTFVHRSLWPALLAVATCGEPWQKTSAKTKGELQKRLLMHGEEVHTESGRHELVLRPWSEWASRYGVEKMDSVEDARAQLEAAIVKIGGQRSLLPWSRPRRPR